MKEMSEYVVDDRIDMFFDIYNTIKDMTDEEFEEYLKSLEE